MNLRKSLLFVLAGSICLVSGCAAVWVAGGAAAGAGTVAYVQGELRSTLEASLDNTWAATKDAMTDLEFNITETEKDAVEAELIARGARDKKIRIILERQTPKLTRIGIRVDTFGDEQLSRLILDKIKARL